MTDIASLIRDLADEQTELDHIVAPLDDGAWDTPTPAEGWSVRHQVAHLAFFDRAAATAISDPDAFAAERAAADTDPVGYGDSAIAPLVALGPDELLALWREGRVRLGEACAAAPADKRVPWYGPSMSLASTITARLMETWAHGQDVEDAGVGVRPITARLRHVVHIGVRARPFSYAIRGLQAPSTPFLVDVEGPDGARWVFGEPAAEDRITGPAIDFALLVTQRRHLDDTTLDVVGRSAREWVEIAQAFAGPVGAGRAPGQFPRRPSSS